MNPLISIIVPVYNLESHLTNCLRSLASITYTNLEIIFVNDGSTDGSKEILEDYQQKSCHSVEVINQSNKGVSKARNIGINNSKGKYIMFIDGDDYVESHIIESCVEKTIQSEPELIIFGYYIENLKTSETIKKYIQLEQEILCNVDLSNSFYDIFSQVSINAPWNKMYLKEFLIENKILFSNQKMGEDGIFNSKVYRKVNKVSIVSDPLYHYITQRPGSAQNQYKMEYINDEIKLIEEYRDLFTYWGNSNNLRYILSTFIINAQFKALKNIIIKRDSNFLREIKELKKIFSSLNGLKKSDVNIKLKFKEFIVNFFYMLV